MKRKCMENSLICNLSKSQSVLGKSNMCHVTEISF